MPSNCALLNDRLNAPPPRAVRAARSGQPRMAVTDAFSSFKNLRFFLVLRLAAI